MDDVKMDTTAEQLNPDTVLPRSRITVEEVRRGNRRQKWLFVITALLFACWLIPKGTMVDISGDAMSIWESIKTLYTGNIVPSYVLYKGFLSVYPYVWMYQLSQLLNTNEFLFIMIYHALLFSYITTIGIPDFISRFFKREVKLWQNVLLIVWLFIIWEETFALDQMMVDLPNCAFLLLAIQLAQVSFEREGWKKVVLTVVAASFASMVCVISGQYVLAGWCVIVYMVIKLRPWQLGGKGARRWMALLCSAFMLLAIAWPYVARDAFDEEVVEPLRDAGEWIPNGEEWLQRSLVRSTGYSLRGATEPALISPRGFQILVDYFGSEELAQEKLSDAHNGFYGWTVQEWFSVFAKYPFDFFVLMMDKVFVMLSATGDEHPFFRIEIGYILLFMGLYALTRHIRDLNVLFAPECLLAIAPVASIFPNLVMGVEPRFALSLHALVYGVAILGPTFAEVMGYIGRTYSAYQENGCDGLRKQPFPWPAVMCVLFVFLCNSHIGALYAQSDAAMLFTW